MLYTAGMKQLFSYFHFRIILPSCLFLAGVVTPSIRTVLAADISSGSTSDAVGSGLVDDTEVSPNPDGSIAWDFATELIIQAVNPGYKVDGTNDTGELIELRNLTGEELDLSNYSLRYTNSSGSSTTLVSFAPGTILTQENLLLRYVKSPNASHADLTYATTLALSAGPLELLYGGEVVDSVCWTGKKNCQTAFKSANPTTLVRDSATGGFEHLIEYTPQFEAGRTVLILPASPEDDSSQTPSTSCRGLQFSELYSYYTESATEQFVEFYNPTDAIIVLEGCALRYKNKTYNLSGTIAPDGYFAYYPARNNSSFTLTKNPTSSNTLELLDTNGSVADILEYAHGQRKSAAYALVYDPNGEEIWVQTYALTPGVANSYQEYRNCEAGKVINIATGNCVKATDASSTATDCPDGKYRNPLTNRCKSIESNSMELKPCAEGYERNPETNRCRKITTKNEGADYALVPTTYSSKSTFVALSVVILLVSLGGIYVVWQFRLEIARAFRKTRQRLHHALKDLVARAGRFHRH